MLQNLQHDSTNSSSSAVGIDNAVLLWAGNAALRCYRALTQFQRGSILQGLWNATEHSHSIIMAFVYNADLRSNAPRCHRALTQCQCGSSLQGWREMLQSIHIAPWYWLEVQNSLQKNSAFTSRLQVIWIGMCMRFGRYLRVDPKQFARNPPLQFSLPGKWAKQIQAILDERADTLKSWSAVLNRRILNNVLKQFVLTPEGFIWGFSMYIVWRRHRLAKHS